MSNVCISAIDWTAFSWDAFATLATGVLAVGGAVVIGLRQVAITKRQADISERQTAIMDRQVELQQFTLRSDLFDRRYKVYEATRIFLLKIMSVEQDVDKLITLDWVQSFLGAKTDSRILFPSNVHPALDEIWKKATVLFVLITEMGHLYQTSGHYGDGNPARKADSIMWFSGRLETLPELFEELNLGVLTGKTNSPSS